MPKPVTSLFGVLRIALWLGLGAGSGPAQQLSTGVELSYPTEYSRPQVSGNRVAPAVPTQFRTRVIGTQVGAVANSGPSVSGVAQVRSTVVLSPQFVQAAAQGERDKVGAMLQAGADPNAINHNGATALMAAAAGGYLEIVQLLISRGAEVNVTSNYGLTALIYAAKNGHGPVVEALLRHGADTGLVDRTGQSARDYARAGQHALVVALLTPAQPAPEDPAK